MFTCKVTSENKIEASVEYAVTTEEQYVDHTKNILSADSKFGRMLYDLVNSNILTFRWKSRSYTISEIKRYRSCKEMIRYNSEDGKQISKVIESNKVKYLVHFTRIENLSSILERGVLSIKELNLRGLEYFNNDYGRNDGRTECSCFSVEFPNISLFNAFNRKQIDSSWIVLLIDVEVLLLQESEKYFCVHNAASRGIREQMKYKQLRTAQDFYNMFSEHVEFSKRNGDYYINRTIDKSYLTTSGQAEILIEGVVDREFIKGIMTRRETDKLIVDSLLNQYNLKDYIESVLEPRYFIERSKVKFKER